MYPVPTRKRALSLLAQGWSVSMVSKQLGVSRAAVREWRDHGVEPRRRSAPCFVCVGGTCDEPDAYAALLGYYLGDGCISRQRRTFSLRVSCDKSYPGIVQDVGAAIEAVHVGGRVCHVKGPGVTVVQSCWNHWPCLFPQHGPGRKHERELELAPWQRRVITRSPGPFLRGLFHSDGSRTNNWTTRQVSGVARRYDYPRWQFVNHSSDIRAWCAEALDLLGIPWRQSKWNCVSVSTRAGVAQLDEVIGLKR